MTSALPWAIGEASNDEKQILLAAPNGTASKSLPSSQTIDLTDTGDDEIRAYYASVDGQSGKTLLSGLKGVLKNMYYFSYANVWKIYEITDRNWELSPASSTTYGTYDSANSQITSYQYGTSNSNGRNNPYVRAVYRDSSEAGQIHAWGNHNASGINREHLWPQSRGFKDPDEASGPAGTDLHHLLAADGAVNQSYHNNNPYGNVDSSKSGYKEATGYIAGNLLGTSSYDGTSTVFEPSDQYKGDIARALFYMAARYNNWAGESGVISAYEPFLEITNQAYDVSISGGTVTSSDTSSATMGILHDLLEWHEEDPVDQFEIHRNNLIYNNYQENRNPFIDFPEWVTYIWGTSDDVGTSKGSANPQSDTINGYNPEGGDSSSSQPSSSEEKTSSSEPLSSSDPASSSEPAASSSNSSSSSGSGDNPLSELNIGLIAAIAGAAILVIIMASIIFGKGRKRKGRKRKK